MRANYELEELNHIQIENNRKTAMLQLKQHMNNTTVDNLELLEESKTIVTENISDPQSLFAGYTTWSPYFKSFEAILRATEKNLSICRSQLYPSISSVGSINTGFSETNIDNILP